MISRVVGMILIGVVVAGFAPVLALYPSPRLYLVGVVIVVVVMLGALAAERFERRKASRPRPWNGREYRARYDSDAGLWR